MTLWSDGITNGSLRHGRSSSCARGTVEKNGRRQLAALLRVGGGQASFFGTSGLEGGNRRDEDAVRTAVGGVAHAAEDAELSRRALAVLLEGGFEGKKILCGGVDLIGSELDVHGDPGTVRHFDHRIDFLLLAYTM